MEQKPAWGASPYRRHFLLQFKYTGIDQTIIFKPRSAVNGWISRSGTSTAYGPINSWDTSTVTDMSGLFADASGTFNDDISNWDTSKVTDMSGMFKGATVFNKNIATNNNKWKVAAVTTMENMFNGANSFDQDITNWLLNNTISLTDMFLGTTSMSGTWSTYTSYGDTPAKYFFANTEDITQANIYTAVNEWTSNKTIATYKYGPIFNWITSFVTDMSGLFEGQTNFNDNIGSWDTSNVVDMNAMFKNATVFNNGAGSNTKINPLNWNTSNVINMKNMFYGASAFNQSINTYNTLWNTDKVTDMEGVFSGASTFNSNIGGWNTSSVTNMKEMFYGATTFNKTIRPIGTSKWNIDKVTDMLCYVFCKFF